MQVVQYTSNMYRDSNENTNKTYTYKCVTKCICLPPHIILGKQCSFLCEA